MSDRQEFGDLTQNPPEGISVALPNTSTVHTWHVTLSAPADSAYSPGRFGILLQLPADYPFKPPTIRFATRIYHPNVTNDAAGSICLGVVKAENWKPSTKIVTVLEHIRGLLVDPAPDDPLEDRIAQEYKQDRAAFEKNVKQYVQKYALTEPSFPPV